MLKLSLLVLFVFNVVLLLIINHEVKSPYMDEIFHFPQALKYYHGVFTDVCQVFIIKCCMQLMLYFFSLGYIYLHNLYMESLTKTHF